MPASNNTHSQPEQSRQPERVAVAAVVSTGKYGALRGRAPSVRSRIHPRFKFKHFEGRSGGIEGALKDGDGCSLVGSRAGGNHGGEGHNF